MALEDLTAHIASLPNADVDRLKRHLVQQLHALQEDHYRRAVERRQRELAGIIPRETLHALQESYRRDVEPIYQRLADIAAFEKENQCLT
jgi:hypothetical protein